MRIAGLLPVLALAALTACGGQNGAAAARGASVPADSASLTPRDTAAARGDASSDTVGPSGLRVTTLDVGGHAVSAEVAETDAERQHGLMYRDSIPEDHGMLFVYPDVQTLSFWMRNTEVALDIAFVDPKGRIVDIQHMQPESDSLHTSSQPAMYALEMNLGWFERHGVHVGDHVGF